MSQRYRDYGGAAFSIPDADFQRDATLKRRRQLSPPRPAAPPRRAAPADGSIAMRARSKSKSRARVAARKTTGQEFVALGSNRAGGAFTLNTNKASYYRPPEPQPAVRASSRSPRARQSRWDAAAPPAAATGRRNPSPISMRTRSKSVTREKEDTAVAMRRSQRERSKSAARRSGGAPLSARKESAALSRPSRTTERSEPSRKRGRSKSEARARERERESKRDRTRQRERSVSRSRRSRKENSGDEQEKSSSRSSRRTSRTGSTLQEIETAIADTERELSPKKKELEELREELAKFQKRVDDKELEVYDLQVNLDALKQRRDKRLSSHRSASSRAEKSSRRYRSKSTSKRRESRRSTSRPRASKRPCIVDEDDDDSDDEVIIMDPSEVKKELESATTTVVPVEDTMPDHFWGRSPTPKLLANHRFRAVPDGSIRKGRHLAFNPIQPQIFATSPDEGGLILWSYQRQDQEISKVVTLIPASFREENSCAEAISWSPDGNRMAMAFRDSLLERGEFCIVQLHQLKLEDSDTPLPIPPDRIMSKQTGLHPRGISAINWLPTGYGPQTTSRQVITTGNSDHAVVLWEEIEDRENGGLDLKFNLLHRDHRSEVKALCVHSKRDCLYTGGLDGLLIRYDLNKGRTETVIERRKPISKINAVLEHPHNPNLLLVSSVEQSEHNLLLHDLRQRYDPNGMRLSWQGGTMSQYVVPRWSPAGYHVSCGSKTGVVNIWDVRMRGENYPTVLPQQSLRVHHKTVLHATWHPRYDAMFSVSHDRTLGLLTFR